MRAHSGLAVGCLLLGLADVLYLDLVVGPSLLGDRSDGVRAADDTGAASRAVVAAKPADNPARPALLQARPGAGSGRQIAPTPSRRALDAELSVGTGAEPEPESELEHPAEPAGPEAESSRDGGPRAPRSRVIQVQFARDHASLLARARSQLDRLAGLMAVESGLRVIIDGHADHRGETDYNDVLSRRRAESVSDYLADRGIDRSRMIVRAFGERRPVDTADGADANRHNRRVEIRILR